MTRLFLIIILNFSVQSILVNNSVAQTRKIILQIDTIENNGYIEFFIKASKQKTVYPYLIKNSDCFWSSNSLTCLLTIQNDTSTVSISIDKKGGYLELNNIYKLTSDTIKISKIFVFKNQYPDTNWTTINYFKIQNDSLTENFKNVKKYNVDRINKEDSKPISTSYIINDKRYYCQAIWKPSNNKFIITKFHGYKKRGVFKKRKAIYFHGSTKSSNTVNVIQINLE